MTRRSSEIVSEAVRNGQTPLEYMLAVMRDETQPKTRRDDMAKSAAPFMHPRLATTMVTGDADKPIHFVARLPAPAASEDEWRKLCDAPAKK